MSNSSIVVRAQLPEVPMPSKKPATMLLDWLDGYYTDDEMYRYLADIHRLLDIEFNVEAVDDNLNRVDFIYKSTKQAVSWALVDDAGVEALVRLCA